MPGIGLMKKRLETEKQAISLATAGIMKSYNIDLQDIKVLETEYDDDAGDWYVAIGFASKRTVIKMDSVHATILEIKEV